MRFQKRIFPGLGRAWTRRSKLGGLPAVFRRQGSRQRQGFGGRIAEVTKRMHEPMTCGGLEHRRMRSRRPADLSTGGGESPRFCAGIAVFAPVLRMRLHVLLLLLLVLPVSSFAAPGAARSSDPFPMAVSTWPFVEAVRAAWRVVDAGFSAVDAVVDGCSACEELRCDGTVGPGGSPDENGETTLDALVMNGTTMEVGAVAAMRYVKDGIKAAKLVMEHTKHTLIVGEKASIFAISMGLQGPSNLSSPESLEKWIRWKASSCQPNFRKNIIPTNSCGPYHLTNRCEKNLSGDDIFVASKANSVHFNRRNHDTISMAAIDKAGRIAVGTSTNGATFKIPGRVGDGPIAGSSAYADDEVGACGATGDGDIMMRFLPCYQAVESMRQGMDPSQAANDAISRITRKYPGFVGAVFAINKDGVHAGACHGWTFQYSARTPGMEDVQVFTVAPSI